MQSANYDKLHVAIIMDGNGRWARSRGLPRTSGHRAGIKALRDIVRAAPRFSVHTITVYVFSADNWRRPVNEVSALMKLLEHYLEHELAQLLQNNVRLSAIGRRDRLPPSIQSLLEKAETKTLKNNRLHLRMALDYSARDAILTAAAIEPGDLTREKMSHRLNGGEKLEEVDLVIRTGGEKRLSDFLLWEAAYAELYFTDLHWPDFGADDLAKALDDFRGRERRFGSLSTPDKEFDRSVPLAPSLFQPRLLSTKS